MVERENGSRTDNQALNSQDAHIGHQPVGDGEVEERYDKENQKNMYHEDTISKLRI